MAQRQVVELTDDLDGTVIEDGKGETIHFSLDSKEYEIDLTASNARKLRSTLEKYINAGHKAQTGSGRRRGTGRSTTSGPNPADVRAWAEAHGISVSGRGRIPAEVMEQFRAAN